MSAEFQDHVRKQVVRSQYNRPLLEGISSKLATKYVYLGLPGPEMHDVNEWKDLIAKVIAFERPARYGPERRNYEKLQVSLQKCGLQFQCYYGDIETVVVWGYDRDYEPLVQDELITLYNLDFCDHISSRIDVPPQPGVPDAPRECMRFQALRDLLRHQRARYEAGKDPRFIVLLTVREGVHGLDAKACRDAGNNPQEVSKWLHRVLGTGDVKDSVVPGPDLLKPFVFRCFRGYCEGPNIATHFLPMVRYQGASEKMAVPMAHFAVLCRFCPSQDPLPAGSQSAKAFLRTPSLRADEDGLREERLDLETGNALSPAETVEVAQQFLS